MFISAAGLLNFLEVKQLTFSSYAEARDHIKKGWIPEILPEDATDIHLQYDIDTNETWLTFRTQQNLQEDVTLKSDPKHIDFNKNNSSWWPKVLNTYLNYEEQDKIIIYEYTEKSPNKRQYIAIEQIDESTYQVYYWAF